MKKFSTIRTAHFTANNIYIMSAVDLAGSSAMGTWKCDNLSLACIHTCTLKRLPLTLMSNIPSSCRNIDSDIGSTSAFLSIGREQLSHLLKIEDYSTHVRASITRYTLFVKVKVMIWQSPCRYLRTASRWCQAQKAPC